MVLGLLGSILALGVIKEGTNLIKDTGKLVDSKPRRRRNGALPNQRAIDKANEKLKSLSTFKSRGF